MKMRDKIKGLEEALRLKTADHQCQKDMRGHYQELFETSCKEHQFGLVCVEHLYGILEEITEFTKDKTVLAFIENAQNRHQLDKIIHAKKIFDK